MKNQHTSLFAPCYRTKSNSSIISLRSRRFRFYKKIRIEEENRHFLQFRVAAASDVTAGETSLTSAFRRTSVDALSAVSQHPVCTIETYERYKFCNFSFDT
ncbi:hypothetical protein CEXT_62321 [Caerostris extrusa]|uniref:Uncharacterized protein n=1 Tax=Caerostris extrusa TaxID=172846 RepID=A0AAV4MB78_CAEEX|nr:hypothetical protein CEXT_62321 [Caerostris extrusa]